MPNRDSNLTRINFVHMGPRMINARHDVKRDSFAVFRRLYCVLVNEAEEAKEEATWSDSFFIFYFFFFGANVNLRRR